MSDFLPFVIVGLTSGSIFGLAGIGLVLTYKISGIFNFAHGAIAAAMAYLFYEFYITHGLPWPAALVLTVLICGPAAGLLMELLARGLADSPPVAKIVATLGLVVAIPQLVVIIFGTDYRNVPQFLPTRLYRIAGVNVAASQIIIMVIVAAAAAALFFLFRSTRLGLAMRGVVDNAPLLASTGASPVMVRRWAWAIGSAFAALSGVLIVPTIGLDAATLTQLVVQAFGAAAIGLFVSLPLTYIGGLVLGVAAALSSKYVSDVPWLVGIPPSLPFIFLFGILLLVPRKRLVEVGGDYHRHPRSQRQTNPRVVRPAALVGLAALIVAPHVFPTRMPVLMNGLAMVLLFMSLAVLLRMSGQISLAQMSFAAVGAATFSHLVWDAGLPWLIGVLGAGLAAVPVGAIVAIPAIRLSGLYLALATYGFGILMQRLLFNTFILFGEQNRPLPAPRPSFALSDNAYYYVLLICVMLAAALFYGVRRSRLGRLLLGLADSPTALSTLGTNVTAIKVIVFCLSAFLAGLAGALMGPIGFEIASGRFTDVLSLLLVVILLLYARMSPLPASFLAAISLTVVPTFLDSPTLSNWLPVVFGAFAILVAIQEGRAEGSRRRPAVSPLPHPQSWRLRSPVAARLAAVQRTLGGL